MDLLWLTLHCAAILWFYPSWTLGLKMQTMQTKYRQMKLCTLLNLKSQLCDTYSRCTMCQDTEHRLTAVKEARKTGVSDLVDL